ncbi:MAG: hypothetical protein DBX45_02695 [Oscillospiraceae bacterium]|nr:MAG: hypothetical protein DBX45_02695 [Oscillospiraceae bacterium]
MATATATLEHISEIDGALLARMVREGTARLRTHAQEVNNLNVFPIPDGDTGSNMLQTASGGADSITSTESGSIGKLSRRISDGMLLSARGNSGVILSQIFEGMARAFDGAETADAELIIRAMQSGTRTAYDAVMQPTEGTMLTVMRCATDYVAGKAPSLPVELLRDFISEAKRTLERTPDMLPVLKRAGVVDSGGAGLIYIAEGMLDALLSDSSSEENVDTSWQDAAPSAAEPDLDSFDENSKLEYGYCTELLLRLQRSKTDPETLRVESLTEWLSGIGDSVVAFKTGSIVKLHIHTKTPDRVLAFCQRYGEFLKVKIENMSLQHNSSMLGIGENTDYNDNDAEPAPSADAVDTKTTEAAPKKQFGIVVVASGEGVKQLFSERGADIVIDGGQSMNPSARDFIDAFREVSAQTVFVLPNNGNIILAAKQAAELYTDADIRVIECTTVGEGYAAISMFSDESGDADTIESELRDALGGVVTAGISRSIRDSGEVKAGEYIGFVGKDIIADSDSRLDAARKTADKLGLGGYDVCIILRSADASAEEASELESYINSHYPNTEVYLLYGGQPIYDYIIILE